MIHSLIKDNFHSNNKYSQSFNHILNTHQCGYILVNGKKINVQDGCKFIRLISNIDFDIHITAEVDKISSVNSYWENRYYIRKFRIQYKNEFIEVDADSLNIKNKSTVISHLRMIEYLTSDTLNKGIYSDFFKSFHPVNKDFTKSVKFSIASILYLQIVSDPLTEQMHNINLFYFIDLESCFGALIDDSQDYYIDSLDSFE